MEESFAVVNFGVIFPITSSRHGAVNGLPPFNCYNSCVWARCTTQIMLIVTMQLSPFNQRFRLMLLISEKLQVK